jgi:hypothetical protein
MATKREELNELERLILDHLLSALRDSGKPPRASMIQAALSFVKAHGDLPTPPLHRKSRHDASTSRRS